MSSKPKRILAITSIRSDYDLMAGLFRLIHEAPDMELKLLVSGAHLSPQYGQSVDLIRKDGFDILLETETLIDSNSKQSRLKTGSLLLLNAIDSVARYQPDFILYAGDREDVIVGALLGGYLEISTLHFFGGDHATDGNIDNPVRHATSKLSTYHFVSIPQHEARLKKIGEPSARIFQIGSISLDKFVSHQPVSKAQIQSVFSVGPEFDDFALVIFHPLPEERAQVGVIFESILTTLKAKGIRAFVSYPNTDPGNKDIVRVIETFQQDPNFIFYKNLERDLFLSIFKQCRFILGNSSAGIIEAASIPVPAINVGKRQLDRFADANVVFVPTDMASILAAIDRVESPEFRAQIKGMKNSYGDGTSTVRAFELIRSLDPKRLLYKREDPLH